MNDASVDLKVVSPAPFNAETRLEGVDGGITPAGRHYVRNHFAVPSHDGVVRVDGSVAHPLEISVDDLRARVSVRQTVTLECAGNGRSFLTPQAPGEQWSLGAVGTAEWAGLPLADVLADAGVLPSAVELLFTGADFGLVGAVGREMSFQRSLPIGDAGSAFLVVEMNGEPLTANHGAPVRLLVPGRYGMASVKWLSRITALDAPFQGFFQVDRYVVDGRPLGPIAPRAVIASPVDGASVAIGREIAVHGFAWSGAATVDRVDVSADGGTTWAEASLGPIVGPKAWREWSFDWRPDRRGETTLLARATDATGATQPLDQVRNDLGYGNNAARPVSLTVG
jgi:DMSO/TMAO reductase YedYZ molybdopterin-dependent catalytic subunit